MKKIIKALILAQKSFSDVVNGSHYNRKLFIHISGHNKINEYFKKF